MPDQFIRLGTHSLDHLKIQRLMNRLGEGAIVWLLRLWVYAANCAPNGCFPDVSAKELGSIARARKPELFVETLLELHLLDNGDGGGYRIHDWAEHQPWIVGAKERSEQNRKAANKRWSQRGEPTDDSNDSSGTAESKRQQAQALVDSWNAIVKRLPKVEKLTAQRIAHSCARLKDHTPEELGALFKRLDDSDLAAKGWGSFDWITKSEDNLTKLREGNYDNHRGANGSAARPMPTGSEYLERLEDRT